MENDGRHEYEVMRELHELEFMGKKSKIIYCTNHTNMEVHVITNMSTYLSEKNPIDAQELWSTIADICNSHKLLFDLYNIQQERIIYLEKHIGSNAVLPSSCVVKMS